MQYPVTLRRIDDFIDQERFLIGTAWNGPIPKTVKRVRVRYKGNTKECSIAYMGSDTFKNGKAMDFWRIDLDIKNIISSTYQFSNRHRCVGPFNFYMIRNENSFKLYEGPRQFSILECL